MYLVSGISGAKAADMAAIAPAHFPEMQMRGAKAGDLVALLAATGAQTETIPPSLVLIITGSVTGVSIAALFTGGLLPSLVLAIVLCLVVRFRYRNEDLSHVKRATRAEIGRSLVIALPALALPFLIRAAVVEGIATATEVSTIGIVYSIIVGLLIYRQFDWSKVFPMLVDTAALSGAILLIIAGATAMAWGLTQSGFSRALAVAMTGVAGRSDLVSCRLDRDLHHSRQRSRGHSSYGAVRAAAVSDRAAGRRARSSLCNGRHHCHGPGPVRAAFWGWLLCCVRHCACPS